MKKNKVKKLIAKELARFDNRIFDVEVKTGIKPFEIRKDTFTQAIAGDIAVKDAEYLKRGEDKTEILPGKFVPKGVDAVIKQTPEPTMTHPELPAKWCVRVTESNVEVLENWRSQGVGSLSSVPICGFLCYDKIWTPSANHDEITFSDFERFVLKKAGSSKMESAELEVKKWYKQSKEFAGVKQYLICITEKDDLGVGGYGICDGVWFNNGNCYSKDLIPASKEEVEEALKNEAKNKYKAGNVVFDNYSQCKRTITRFNPVFDYGIFFNLENDNSKTCLFNNGIWAEIVSQPEQEEEIDWNVPQLVTNEYGTIWFLIKEKKERKKYFVGIALLLDSKKVHIYSETILKDGIKPFKGEITLKNDN